MATFTVVYDACLLYPVSIRDLLVELARTGLFKARWTARIHREWIDAAICLRPELDIHRLERVSALMNAAVPDSLIGGFESTKPVLTGMPDADDLPEPLIPRNSSRPPLKVQYLIAILVDVDVAQLLDDARARASGDRSEILYRCVAAGLADPGRAHRRVADVAIVDPHRPVWPKDRQRLAPSPRQ